MCGSTTSRATPTSSRRTSATCARRSTSWARRSFTPSGASATPCAHRRRTDLLTLRTRLLIGLVGLAAVGLGVSGFVTYRELRTHLVNQRDSQLQAALNSGESLFHKAIATGEQGPGGVPAGTYARLLDPQTGRTLAVSNFDYKSATPPRFPHEITVGRPFTLHHPHFIGSSKLTGGGVMVVALSMADVDSTLNRLLFIEIFVAAGVLLALAVLAWLVVKLGLRPLRQMQETAGAIAAGDLSRRVEVEDEQTEVGQLGLALNKMLQEIERAFEERAESEAR